MTLTAISFAAWTYGPKSLFRVDVGAPKSLLRIRLRGIYWLGTPVSCRAARGMRLDPGRIPLPMIYHIVEETVWHRARADGWHVPASLQAEGFIHFSLREQVADTANRFYEASSTLVVLEVDPARTGAEVRHEAAADGAGVFPHLYGPVPVDAVIRVLPLERDPAGRFVF